MFSSPPKDIKKFERKSAQKHHHCQVEAAQLEKDDRKDPLIFSYDNARGKKQSTAKNKLQPENSNGY